MFAKRRTKGEYKSVNVGRRIKGKCSKVSGTGVACCSKSATVQGQRWPSTCQARSATRANVLAVRAVLLRSLLERSICLAAAFNWSCPLTES
jgi:hypothetical protein